LPLSRWKVGGKSGKAEFGRRKVREKGLELFIVPSVLGFLKTIKSVLGKLMIFRFVTIDWSKAINKD
jgi:hypothetical protein